MGPGSLTAVLITKRGCLPQNMNPISQTPKSILGITQTITKTYLVTMFNQNIFICTMSMSDLFNLPKPSGVSIRSSILLNLHNVLNVFPCILISNMTFRKNVLTYCIHSVLCFILISLICNMTSFRKERKLTIRPLKGVCV